MAHVETTKSTDNKTPTKAVLEERDGVVVQLHLSQEALERLNTRKAAAEYSADFENDFRTLISETPKGEKTVFRKERDHLLSEMIFLKHRDASLQKASERIAACDLIASDMASLELILSTTDPKENRRIYDEISVLRTIYVNQLITIDHRKGNVFEEQSGLARIELMRFLLRKTDLCYRKGIKLNNKNYDDLYLTDTELRLDKIENDVRQLLREAFAIGARNPEMLAAFKANVAAFTADTDMVELPSKAPELYKDRENRDEKPVDFIGRVYLKWLGKGLLRPHIKAFDEPLYRALYKHGIPKSFDELLPKASGKSVRTKNLSEEEALERKRTQARERSKRMYHARKQNA